MTIYYYDANNFLFEGAKDAITKQNMNKQRRSFYNIIPFQIKKN